MDNNYRAIINSESRKLPILFKSIAIGLFVGIVIAAYRFTLLGAEAYSFKIYRFVSKHLALLPIVLLLLGAAGYFIGMLISKYPMISGSGIPQVKGVMMGYFQYNWLHTLVAKFFGGAVSLLAGLSLGREGPSIQLGACVAQGIGDKYAASRTEKKVLIASGASAGLAAAFNAPLAGTMFAMEEIFKYFSPAILLSSMTAAVVSDFITNLLFGMDPIFHFDVTNNIPLSGYWLLFILGAVLGVFGTFYNYMLLLTQKLYRKSKWLTRKTRPMIPFLLAGILGCFFPLALGGGNIITGELQLSTGISFLVVVLVAKFVFSMISFGSGAPGGIFFPLLIIGATIGAIFGNIAVHYFGFDANLFANFIILAMAGFFTAIVRAPITGVILLVEMSGSFTQLLSLTVVSVIAYIVADLLKSKPVYDSLLESQLSERNIEVSTQDDSRKITVEVIVQYGSPAEDKLLKELAIPKNCLLIAMKREGKEFIPKGDTKILPGDYLICLTDVNNEATTREKLEYFTTSIT
ncbi:ClC family H(+)/Cl(-) exchange transporter [Bacillaceae bacterium Marseille-Q3522]|nr:ClC family H(+)/Cl(-) exchange transporter [Bacillaceae bacterium Marseille-Q3522]